LRITREPVDSRWQAGGGSGGVEGRERWVRERRKVWRVGGGSGIGFGESCDSVERGEEERFKLLRGDWKVTKN
jgi:hypothetical protein